MCIITLLSNNKSPLSRNANFCSQRHLKKHINRQILKDISISVPMENARHDKTNVQKIYVVEQMRTTVSRYNFDRLELLTLNSVSNEGV